MKGYKLQSATEYLMTYGWAILIIAAVLGALYQLHVFDARTFQARLPPGGCEIVRANGPSTIQFVNFKGSCNGLLPQTVAKFNGQGQYVNFGNSILLSPEAGVNGAMTLCMWYMPTSLVGWVGPTLKGEGVPTYGNAWEYTFDQGGVCCGGKQGFTVYKNDGSYAIATYSTGVVPVANAWSFACMTYNYPAASSFYYLNAVQHPATWTGGSPATAGTGNLIVGGGQNSYSNVLISNVQLYNSSLSANTITALYRRGIGGAPITLQNLVGWWPLNGDTKDYSGDMLNGVANSMTYTDTWIYTYSQPTS